MGVPLVTIAIPTYNRANGYLRQTLESALAQTYPNLEIMVSDNCSPDDTERVVKAYDDSRIRYFRQQTPLRPNDNFNFLLDRACGEYFLLLHDDDLIDDDFVEACLKEAGYDTKVGLIRAGVRAINPENGVINEGRNDVVGLSPGDFFLGWFNGRTAHYCCNTLFNTRIFREIGGFQSRHNCFQDAIAAFRILATYGRVDVPAVKVSNRHHGGKLAHTARVMEWCEDSKDLLDLMCELAPDKAAEIREQGERYFARVNYSRAGDVRSLWGRVKAFFLVYRFFRYRYPPSFHMLFRTTALYRGLRSAKRRLLGLPPWVD
jgi:glycosyltransferase involved in cell wall biosynthesis